MALYIHIPFCEVRCPYCDFNTYSGIEHLIPAYVDALALEISLWASYLRQDGGKAGQPQQIKTVFFGGGTPSYLPPEYIRRLLDTVRSAFALDSAAEITMESNPGDIVLDRLRAWKSAGVNRLSMGVQSLDDALLRLLGRRHDAEMARQAYRDARQAGFDNVNLDLMYGLPHQSLEQWRQTLDEMLAMRPDHLSMYCLTLEGGTPMEAWVRQGKLPDPDPDLAADMYCLAEDMAAKAGYQHYEISNWALPERECDHNLVYWRNQPYLGVGPGAHSYLGGFRFANLKSPQEYIRRVKQWSQEGVQALDLSSPGQGSPVETSEVIDARMAMAETMMLGLRLDEGVSEEGFRQRFGVGLRETYALQIAELEQVGLLEWAHDSLKLTDRGHLLGNEVFQRFLA